MFAPSCGICFSRKDVRKLTTTAESLCNIPNNLLPKIEQTREVKFFLSVHITEIIDELYLSKTFSIFYSYGYNLWIS